MTSVNFATKINSIPKMEDYKSIPNLIEELSSRIAELEDGKLNVSDLESLSDNARELYERLLVLKHLAYEDLVKEKEAKKPEQIPFKIGKNKNQAPIPENQTSLIDAIEEIDESVNDEPVVEEIQTKIELEEELELPTEEIKEEAIEEVHIPEETESIVEEPEEDLVVQEKVEEGQKDSSSIESESIVEKHSKTAISNLRSEINLNQKFQFINILFDGDNKLYDSTLQKLNEQNKLDEALSLYESTKVVDQENEDCEEVELMFKELLERRYI